MTSRESAAASSDGAPACRLAEAVATCYGRNARSVERIARGMGTANWLVRTSGADYFLRRSGLPLRTCRLDLLLAIGGCGEQSQSSADFHLIDFGGTLSRSERRSLAT